MYPFVFEEKRFCSKGISVDGPLHQYIGPQRTKFGAANKPSYPIPLHRPEQQMGGLDIFSPVGHG